MLDKFSEKAKKVKVSLLICKTINKLSRSKSNLAISTNNQAHTVNYDGAGELRPVQCICGFFVRIKWTLQYSFPISYLMSMSLS
jgi:hypothetical protein